MRKLFPVLVAITAIILHSCKGPGSDPIRPNIIFVLADDMGYGDVTAYNPEGKIHTTHLDQLAEEGMMFTDAHTSSAVCSPTRYAILTGRYDFRSPMKQGVLWGMSESIIPVERTTIASMMQEKGYHTAYIGKWHLGWTWPLKDTALANQGSRSEQYENIDYEKPIDHSPNDLGFNYAYGHSGSLDMPPYVYVENEYVTSPPNRIEGDKDRMRFFREGPTGADFVHEQVTPHFFEKAMQYIRDRSKEKEPFFLYLPLPSPHTPILPTAEFEGESGLNLYGDFVLMIDDYMGKLLKVLDEERLTQNTMVVFTSDNGCSPRADFDVLAEKGHYPGFVFRGAKSDLYEGGHRVPFIVRWPGVVKPGSESDATICSMDMFATLADLTGYETKADEAEDSFSFLPLLEGKPGAEAPRPSLVSHSLHGKFAIRKGDWKLLLCNYSGGWGFPSRNDTLVLDTMPDVQLFHLGNDIGETTNLQAEYPEKVEELKSEMIRIYLEGRSTEGPMQENDPPMFDWYIKPWFIAELE